MKRCENRIRHGCVIFCLLFALATLVTMWGQPSRVLLTFATMVLVLLPELLQRLLRCRICLPVYLFTLCYAIGPMLGHCYNFYYSIPYWDKLLHITGGVMFVIFGIYLYSLLGADSKKRLACGVFALCFSIAIAVVWEFFEFGMDQLFRYDMQSDAVVTTITSYWLGSATGEPGSLADIHSVAVNGQALPFPGYLDIGLMDTMADMLLESAGALLTTAAFWLDRNRHPLIVQQKKSR